MSHKFIGKKTLQSRRGKRDFNWKSSINFLSKPFSKSKINGNIDANQDQEPVSYDFYYIVTDKCTECKGFHEEPQCAAVCPVECCVPDENNVETEKDLLTKKAFLHCE